MNTIELVRDVMNTVAAEGVGIEKRSMTGYLFESVDINQDTVFVRNPNKKNPESKADGIYQVGLHFAWMKLVNEVKNGIRLLNLIRRPLIIGYFLYFVMLTLLTIGDLNDILISRPIAYTLNILNVIFLIVVIIIELKYWKLVSPIYLDSAQEALRVFDQYEMKKKDDILPEVGIIKQKLVRKYEFWKFRTKWPRLFRTPFTLLFLLGISVGFRL